MATQQVKSDLNLDGAFQASGAIRSDSGFNVNSYPGVSDTVTFVTAVQEGTVIQVKTRTLTFSGGICTEISAESDWT